MPKVFIVQDNGQYGHMFRGANWDVVHSIVQADMVQFTGGEDVTPALFGEKQHPYTGNNFPRDLYEAGYFAIAKRLGKPMSGICRGGQFLNVMSGGSMYQHVIGHANGNDHELIDVETGRGIEVSSTHHQMMLVGEGGILVASANLGGFKEDMRKGEVTRHTDDKVDVESVYYPHSKALCFQPHPEFFGPKNECNQYYFELIERYHGLSA